MKFLGVFDWFRRWRPTPTPPPVPPTPPDGGDWLAQLHGLHNFERKTRGFRELTTDPRLNAAAQKHAEWMLANKRMSHIGKNGSNFVDRIDNEGYDIRGGGENVAAGYATATAVFRAWMNSTGHRNNILNPGWYQAGYGMAGNYWCTVFAIPGSGAAVLYVTTELDVFGDDGL